MTAAPPEWAITLVHEIQALRRELRDLRAAAPVPAVVVVEDDPVARLRAEAERLGVSVTMDGYVSETGAARLLGLSEGTLKRRRLAARPIVPARRFLGRWQCSLDDLARLAPENVEDFFEF